MIDDILLMVLKNAIDANRIYEEPAKGRNILPTGTRGGLDRDAGRSI